MQWLYKADQFNQIVPGKTYAQVVKTKAKNQVNTQANGPDYVVLTYKPVRSVLNEKTHTKMEKKTTKFTKNPLVRLGPWGSITRPTELVQ